MERKAETPRFIRPKVTALEYLTMTVEEFTEMCEGLYRTNEKWFDATINDKGVTSALVTHSGKVVETSCRETVLSVIQITEKSREYGQMVYQLIRSPTYMDTMIYFRETNVDAILDLLDRKKEDVGIHKEEIRKLRMQSGALRKLRDDFLLGAMKDFRPRVGDIRYAEGATIAKVENYDFGDGKSLYIASQSADKAHERGRKTIVDREPERWIRMERLHRVDDPVLDIFDTYRINKSENWPELVLYKIVRKKSNNNVNGS
jgi:hypothetical protein